MTDAETYAAICADFPFETATLQAVYSRLHELFLSQNGMNGGGDGTISDVEWKRLRILTWAMRDLVGAMEMVETSGNPDEWIPF